MPVALGSAASSSYRDRTSELHSIAERLRKTQAFSGSAPNTQSSAANGSVDGSARTQGPQSCGSVQSEFNKLASRIGLSIHQTSQKLSKLTKLAKRTSMFDDPAIEIQELTAVIKEDIKALNEAIFNLQGVCDSRNDGGNRSTHSSEHSTTVVDNLKSRLMSTTREFTDVLTLRTENLKVHENRRQLFTATPSKEQSNPFSRQGPLANVNRNITSSNAGAGPGPGTSTSASPVTHPWANGGAATQTPLFSRRRPNADGGSTPGLLQSQMQQPLQQQQQQQQQLVPGQDSYMQSRAEALRNVESTIIELSSIFTQLATMVHDQHIQISRIDDDLGVTAENVEGAQGALLKYLNGISSNRWLIIKIFFVLIIFLLIFVVFVA